MDGFLCEKTQNYIHLLSVCLSIIYGEGDRPELLESVPFLFHKDPRDDLRSSALEALSHSAEPAVGM